MIDQNYKVASYPPQYLASQVITKEWVQPIDAPHKLFKAASDVNDAAGHVLVTAYAVERPDGQWSVMLVNRDQYNDHAVKISFSGGKRERHFSGPLDRITFGSNEYQWHREGPASHADPMARLQNRQCREGQTCSISSRKRQSLSCGATSARSCNVNVALRAEQLAEKL